MPQLILVRHGQTDWDKQDRVRGSLDIPLNGEGQQEARRISGELSGYTIDAVYSGHSSCSFFTATEIALPHKLTAKKWDDLNELNHGVWQGLLIKDVKKRYKRQYHTWKTSPVSARLPKGETLREAYDRAVSAIHTLIDKHHDENVCVVSGDVVLSAIKCHFKSIDLEKIWSFAPEKMWWEVLEV
jgi:broad specificity phosphatase PhoE